MSSCNSYNLKNTSIKFFTTFHNFGEIRFRSTSENAIFYFTNTGKYPLKIEKVETNCGCVLFEFTKDFVKPDHEGQIIINYDSRYSGNFKQTIKVFYNGVNSPDNLKIKGEVLFPE
ncbi:DUF1573 domain-containing protein [Tamlana sp. 62-3]|uniref:DUF1573 domain-containing protein n=1 Tax=Neotamlana sargassicola TaxID=2883125 RepID=A0A9X1I620_9FLAO|nr:DUF1573 domain-containing protein [Tamlana sargassicola]